LFANSDVELNLSRLFNLNVPDTVVCIESCEPVTEKPRSPAFLICEFTRTSTYLCETLRQIRLEQIEFLLGQSSTQTTERHHGSEPEVATAVNDNVGL
jgi:hypothetical protein